MSHFSIETRNYHNDIRTLTGPEIPEGFPTCWAICPVCTGDGTVVNPSIDCGGLSSDMQDDPEFMDGYMSGVYDIACNYCGGSGKVKEIDRENADPYDLQAYDTDRQNEAEVEAEHRAERAMGA